MVRPVRIVDRQSWRANRLAPGERAIPEETAIAFTYNGTSYAVMMATPQDLEDFAYGFSLTEGMIDTAADIRKVTLGQAEEGLTCRIDLVGPFRNFRQHRDVIVADFDKPAGYVQRKTLAVLNVREHACLQLRNQRRVSR